MRRRQELPALGEEDLRYLGKVLYEKKAINILGIDVRGISTLTDYFLVAEGNVDRHVQALSHAIMDAMDERGIAPLHVEGKQEGDWVVMDYGTLIVHLFVPELRNHYRLEEVWKAGALVDLHLSGK